MLPPAMAAFCDFVRFNVGGTEYQVARSTLMKFPDTMLAVMVSERWSNESETNQVLTIDRDPLRFRFILDYYRDGRVNLPLTVSKGEVLTEAAYFGLPLTVVDIEHSVDDQVVGRKVAKITQANDLEYCDDLDEEAQRYLEIATSHHLMACAIRKLTTDVSATSTTLLAVELTNTTFQALCPRVLSKPDFQTSAYKIASERGFKFQRAISEFCFELGHGDPK